MVYLDEESDVYENWILWREMWTTRSSIRSFGPPSRSRIVDWVAGLADLVRAGQADGSIPASVVGEDVAWRLTAFVEGLGPLMLLGMVGRERWRELISGAVALELGQVT